jgi:hypothetical protein
MALTELRPTISVKAIEGAILYATDQARLMRLPTRPGLTYRSESRRYADPGKLLSSLNVTH